MVRSISFGDNVRVLPTPETRAAGIAGKTGQVFGLTTPSQTGVAVLGAPTGDHAINVCFEDEGTDYWLSEESVEFLDHSAGTTIALEGVDKKWVRHADGSWSDSEQASKTPWWKLWRRG